MEVGSLLALRLLSPVLIALLAFVTPHTLALATDLDDVDNSGSSINQQSADDPDTSEADSSSEGEESESLEEDGSAENDDTSELERDEPSGEAATDGPTENSENSEETLPSTPNDGVTVTEEGDSRVIHVDCEAIVGNHTVGVTDALTLQIAWAHTCDTPDVSSEGGLTISDSDPRRGDVHPDTTLTFRSANGDVSIAFFPNESKQESDSAPGAPESGAALITPDKPLSDSENPAGGGRPSR